MSGSTLTETLRRSVAVASRGPRAVVRAILSRLSGRPASVWQPDRQPRPLVSVVLPVHDEADRLEEAAQSVLRSTYDALELIVVDHGSTDSVEPVLRRLLNTPRVRVLRETVPSRASALARARRLARGDFISWISVDDRLSATAIETMAGALLRHPEVRAGPGRGRARTRADVGRLPS